MRMAAPKKAKVKPIAPKRTSGRWLWAWVCNCWGDVVQFSRTKPRLNPSNDCGYYHGQEGCLHSVKSFTGFRPKPGKLYRVQFSAEVREV